MTPEENREWHRKSAEIEGDSCVQAGTPPAIAETSEERAAWDSYAVAYLVGIQGSNALHDKPHLWHENMADLAAAGADSMLARRRQRFRPNLKNTP